MKKMHARRADGGCFRALICDENQLTYELHEITCGTCQHAIGLNAIERSRIEANGRPFIGMRVHFMPASVLAHTFARSYAWDAPGSTRHRRLYAVKLIAWDADGMIVRGKKSKEWRFGPLDAFWSALNDHSSKEQAR